MAAPQTTTMNVEESTPTPTAATETSPNNRSTTASSIFESARRNVERNAILEENRLLRQREIAVQSLHHDASYFGKLVSGVSRGDLRLYKPVLLAALQSKKPMSFLEYIDENLDWDEVAHPPFIPEEFRNDQEVIMALTTLPDFDVDCDEFQQALGDELKRNKKFMVALCEKYPKAIRLTTPELQDDLDLALQVLSKDCSTLEYLSSTLQNSKDVWLKGLLCASSASSNSKKEGNSYVYEAFCKYVDSDNQDIRDDKGVALALLKTGGEPAEAYRDILCEFSDDVRADYDVIETAVTIDGYMLEDANEDLRNNSTLVEIACKNRGRAYNYASHELRLNEDLARIACKQDGEALIFVLEPLFSKLAEDDEFMKTVVLANQGGRMIISCSLPMQYTEGVVLLALQNGLTFDCVPCHNMRSSKDFVLKALAVQPFCYDYLRRRQQKDKDIVRATILAGYYAAKRAEGVNDEGSTILSVDDIITEYFPELYIEKDVFMFLVTNGHIEQYGDKLSELDIALDEELQSNNKEYMMEVCKYDGRLWAYASETLMLDRDIVEICMKTHTTVFEEVPDDFQIEHTDLALQYIKEVNVPDLPHAVLRQNREIALAYIPKEAEGLELWDALSVYKEDEDIVKAMTIKDPHQMLFAHSQLQTNREFCLSVIRQNGLVLKYLESEFIEDFEFQVAAIANNVEVVDIAAGNENLFLTSSSIFRGGNDFIKALFNVLEFAQSVRERLELHSTFMKDVLCAMEVPELRMRPRNKEIVKESEDAEPIVAIETNAETALNELVQNVAEISLLSDLFGFNEGLFVPVALSVAAVPTGGTSVESNIVHTAPPSNGKTKTWNNSACELPLLHMGKETGTALKVLIADFVGLPRGKELRELRSASMNLAIRGY